MPTKVNLVKAMVFPVVMYGCEIWTIKKAECRITAAFELWCWRRLLRVPWTVRRSNQSILKEISPEYSLEGLMLKLKLNTLATWCAELTHWKRPWCWERLKAEGDGDDRVWDDWMASATRWTWVWASSGNWWWTTCCSLACCSPWGHKKLDMTDWTELNWDKIWRPPSWHISKPCCSPFQFASLRFYNIAQMLYGFGAFCFCLRTQDLCGDLQSVELCPLESFWLSRQRTLS